MGEVINTKLSDDKIIYKILLDENEAQQLKNHMKNVHVFSSDLCKENTKIISRGNKGGAKYFVVPLGLKSRKKHKNKKLSYQKIQIKDQIFFIYTIEKDILFS